MLNRLKNFIQRTFLNSPAAYELFTTGHSASGVSVNHRSVFGLPAFYRAVDLISSTIAKTACPVYRLGKNNSREIQDKHPAYKLLNGQANPIQTSFCVLRKLVSDSIWAGNGYCWIQKDPVTAEPIALWNLNADNVSVFVVYEGLQTDVYYQVTVGTTTTRLRSDEVIHLRGLADQDSIMGMRLIDVLRDSLGLALAVQRYGATYFRNSGGVLTVIELPGKLPNEEAVRTFRAGWEDKHTGLDNAHGMAIMQAGAKVNRMTLSNEEAQFIESRGLTLIDVSNLTGLPAHKLGSTVNSSYSSIEAENTAMLNDTYDPRLVNLEQELNSKCLRESEKASGKYRIEFDRNGLIKGDQKEFEDRQMNKLNNGGISFEEYRASLNLSTEKDETQSWRLPVQVVLEGDDKLDDTLVNPAAPAAPAEPAKPEPAATEPGPGPSSVKRILQASVERLITRIKKDPDVYLAKHKQVFADALPGCERSLDRFWTDLETELAAVLPEQRKTVIERIDPVKLTEQLFETMESK